MSVTYGEGYVPELLGWCIERHGRYYSRAWGFGLAFEAKVATEMAGFLRRVDGRRTRLLWARDDEGFLGTLAMDGGSAVSGLLHLRWFITDDRARGQGIGQRLLGDTIENAKSEKAAGLFLHTFEGLDAAQRLYQRFGFRMVDEHHDTTWGVRVKEQRYELRF